MRADDTVARLNSFLFCVGEGMGAGGAAGGNGGAGMSGAGGNTVDTRSVLGAGGAGGAGGAVVLAGGSERVGGAGDREALRERVDE